MTLELFLCCEVHFKVIAFQHFVTVIEDGFIIHQLVESRTLFNRLGWITARLIDRVIGWFNAVRLVLIY